MTGTLTSIPYSLPFVLDIPYPSCLTSRDTLVSKQHKSQDLFPIILFSDLSLRSYTKL